MRIKTTIITAATALLFWSACGDETSDESGGSSKSATEFTDDFERADGALGDDYSSVTILSETATISGGAACADDTAGVLYSRPISGDLDLSLTFRFDGGNPHVNFRLFAGDDILTDASELGCQGGSPNPGECNLKIKTGGVDQESDHTLTAAVDYTLTVQLTGDMWTLTLSDATGQIAQLTETQSLPAPTNVAVIFGKDADTNTVCIDNLDLDWDL